MMIKDQTGTDLLKLIEEYNTETKANGLTWGP